mmetsp:Transcript_3842/g.9192  ORF Transcript_3842/g.9192 Transcript_3842/m.9192 type:complete len:272 (-) Transcript_3842:1381-2196(-)
MRLLRRWRWLRLRRRQRRREGGREDRGEGGWRHQRRRWQQGLWHCYEPRRDVHGTEPRRGEGDSVPQAGAGLHGQPREVRATEAQVRPRRDPQGGHHQHLRIRPTYGPRPHLPARRPHDPRPRDHRRGDRDRQRRRVHQGGRRLLGALQHRLRALHHVQAGPDGHLPQRQPRPPRRSVRLRRHGWLDRRPGGVRHGSVRGLQPAQVPRQGASQGEDHVPDASLRHLSHGVPRRRDSWRQARQHGVRRRRRSRGPRVRRLRATDGRRLRHRR